VRVLIETPDVKADHDKRRFLLPDLHSVLD
jgi:hypothetical protein